MKIIDLTEEHKAHFCVCLEDWSEEAKEAGPKRGQWIERGLSLGLAAKLALGDNGVVGGMIQYLPIEHSFVDGKDLYMIHCIWVHGYPQGRGDFQKQGMGRALLAAAEDDARSCGAKGMAAWGISPPFWMEASWFKKNGYIEADHRDIAVLVWKPFTDDAFPPRWFHRTSKPMDLVPGKVTVTAFVSGWCLGRNIVYERVKRAVKEFGDPVIFQEIDTSSRGAIAEWGISDDVFLDGKTIQEGPPPSYEEILKMIEGRVALLDVG